MTYAPLHPDQLQTLIDGFRQNAATHASRVHAAAARYGTAREATDSAIRGLGGPLRGLGRPTTAVAAAVAVGTLVYAATKFLRAPSQPAADIGAWRERIRYERANALPQRDDVPPR